MENPLVESTIINIVVNDQHTVTIKNGPDTGLRWVFDSNMNREYYIQALLALEEAAHKSSMHKIIVDADRIRNSNEFIIQG